MRRTAGVALTLLSLVACDGGDLLSGPPDAGALEVVSDPLSMPREPRHRIDDFAGAQACASCHPTHYAQWRTSMHAHAMRDPVFQALVEVRQRERKGQEDPFCVQCHSAIATRAGEITPGFGFDELSPLALEGVTCEACHKVSSIERLYNSGHTLDPQGPMRGPIEQPRPNAYHDSQYAPEMDTAMFCAGCHDVRELNGLQLERPFEEWDQSPAQRQARPCQRCHMPSYRGSAAPGAPQRELHTHTFVGVDVPLGPSSLQPHELDAAANRARELLRKCLRLALLAPTHIDKGAQLDLRIDVESLMDGHNFPTGSTFMRQAWLEVTVRDSANQLIYRTGDLDSNGDLRNAFSQEDPYGDSDLIVFHSALLDAQGKPEMFPWHATEHVSSSLPPRHLRTFTLFVDTASAASGPLSVQARVRFRTHPPYLLRLLGLEALIDQLELHTVAEDGIEVQVRP